VASGPARPSLDSETLIRIIGTVALALWRNVVLRRGGVATVSKQHFLYWAVKLLGRCTCETQNKMRVAGNHPAGEKLDIFLATITQAPLRGIIK